MIEHSAQAQRLRRARLHAILITVIAVMAIASCSTPLDDDADSSTPSTSDESAAPLPTMSIVTPTPVDPAELQPTEEQIEEPGEVPEFYVVQEGDSLYSIAARFDVEIAALVEINELSDPNDILVGQELQIPQQE